MFRGAGARATAGGAAIAVHVGETAGAKSVPGDFRLPDVPELST